MSRVLECKIMVPRELRGAGEAQTNEELTRASIHELLPSWLKSDTSQLCGLSPSHCRCPEYKRSVGFNGRDGGRQ